MDAARLNRLIIAGFAWQGASKLVTQVVAWTSTIFVARLLSPEAYGIMAVAAVFITLLQMFVETGFAAGLVQLPEVTRTQEEGMFFLSAAAGGVLYGAIYFVAPLVADLYRIPVLEDVLRLGGLIVPLAAVQSVAKARVMRRMDFRYRSLVEMVANLLMAATVVTLAVNGAGVWSLVWGPVVNQLVMTVGYLPMMARVPRPTLAFTELLPPLRFGVHLIAQNISFALFSRADVFIIGRYLGEQITGYYAMAVQLAAIPQDKIGSIFNQVAFPSIARAAHDRKRAGGLYADMHRYLFIIGLPLLAGLAVVAEDAVAVLLTEKWLPIVPVMQVLCMVNGLRLSAGLSSAVLNAMGKANLTLRFNLAALVLFPTAFWFAVDYGLQGVAIAWVVVYPVAYSLLLHYVARELGDSIRVLLGPSWSAIVATGLMVFAVVVFQHSAHELGAALRLIGSIGIGVAAYAACYLVLFRGEVAAVRRAIVTLRRGT